MKKEEIISGNKLIAVFMGYQYEAGLGIEHCGWYKTIPSTFDTEKELRFGYREYLCRNDSIKYHKSWDWLMPVVEKIESLPKDNHHGKFGVHISSNTCSIQGTNLHKAIKNLSEYGAVYMSDPNAIFNTKIESTWYNVVAFIKWYNENIKK